MAAEVDQQAFEKSVRQLHTGSSSEGKSSMLIRTLVISVFWITLIRNFMLAHTHAANVSLLLVKGR